MVFYQGEQLEARARKICEGFDATLYPCPNNAVQRRELAIGVETRLEDLRRVLDRTTEHRRLALGKIARELRSWTVKVKKIKGIYHQLNKFNFDNARKCLLAECWCPTDRFGDIREALRLGSERSGSSVPPILNPIATKVCLIMGGGGTRLRRTLPRVSHPPPPHPPFRTRRPRTT